MNEKLKKLLQIEAEDISRSFVKASVEGRGTSQEVSDRREHYLKSTLRKYFPYPYPFRIVKGNIIDCAGGNSNSIDCIVINPSHPYTIDKNCDEASIIFADGVDFAIEIKPKLNNIHELHRALNQIVSVKKLIRKKCGRLKSNCEANEAESRIPSIVFCEQTYSKIRTLIEKIIDFYKENKTPLLEQFDLIVINNRSVLYNMYDGGYNFLIDGAHGIYFSNTNENTFAAFLLRLNQLPLSEVRISRSILSYYIDNEIFEGDSLLSFPDLNQRKKECDLENVTNSGNLD